MTTGPAVSSRCHMSHKRRKLKELLQTYHRHPFWNDEVAQSQLQAVRLVVLNSTTPESQHHRFSITLVRLASRTGCAPKYNVRVRLKSGKLQHFGFGDRQKALMIWCHWMLKYGDECYVEWTSKNASQSPLSLTSRRRR